MVYTRWQDGTHGQAIRDLAIYEKQILEGILESLYGHQGFSKFTKSMSFGGIFESLSSHKGFSNLRKADPLRYFGVSISPSGI